MTTVLFILGIAGILGMTWLFPLAARLFVQAGPDRARSNRSEPASFFALVPAHEEEALLGGALDTIRAALERAKESRPLLEAGILVGADGCSDRTAEIARDKGALVIEEPVARGKWGMLVRLVERADELGAEWVALADAGILWPDSLVDEVLRRAAKPEVMGVAPTYGNPEGGVIERLLWRVERHFKRLESRAGGPVSVHGATIFYRMKELKTVLRALSERAWLNDDVVIPLFMRSLHPEGEILYLPEIEVVDQTLPGSEGARPSEFGRRKRMALGNLQWIAERSWRGNTVVRTLAFRRIFRMLWAYWGLLLLLGATDLALADVVGSSLGSFIVPTAALSTLLVLTLPRIFGVGGTITDAMRASLLVPYYYLAPNALERARWR